MSDNLAPGQYLQQTQSIQSNNGGYELTLQTDGNLVLYRKLDGKALWATGTAGKAVQRAAMQGDGNLVLYSFDQKALWASNTAGKPGSYLIMQNDGNLVIYWPQDPIWASNTKQ